MSDHHYSHQQHYYDEASDPEFEIRRPHGCGRLYEFLIAHKFGTGLDVLGLDLAGQTVLELCCGSGLMTEALARRGARVTGTDVSTQALARARERARRYGFRARFQIADAEALPFRDASFDVVAVHDGLHHLDDPYRAIGEMARVARGGCSSSSRPGRPSPGWRSGWVWPRRWRRPATTSSGWRASEVEACLRAAGFTRRRLAADPHVLPARAVPVVPVVRLRRRPSRWCGRASGA